jgi:D-alanyl-D-alanine carboxypeptidase/D-alanyl-D-alanine-endopeptidase (penicillin-binding protein 4)
MFNDRFSASLLIGWLLLIAGCSTSNTAQSSANSSVAEATSQTATAPISAPSAPLVVEPSNPDAKTTVIVQQYLKKLSSQGFSQTSQGVWMQAGNKLLANHQGTTPLPAASLTKVATSLAALQTFGADHRFETTFGTNGTIENGVVKGDLIVQGNDDPFFVWEEAIAVGNQLNQMGIKQVTGDVIVVGRFFMNFEVQPGKAGALLKQSLNSKSWSGEAQAQYQTLPPGTPRPTVAIAGSVKSAPNPPANGTTLVRHRSLPLAELLKKMNRFSNNTMAEIVASSAGGAEGVASKAAKAANVPKSEILLVNGSGLAVENRISPRAVTAMFLAIEHYLKPAKMTIADIFAVVGRDDGILDGRKLPAGLVTKSGSLNEVSALAGALPTNQKGVVWFVVMNGGGVNLEGFRASQETLLNSLSNQWGVAKLSPANLVANRERANLKSIVEKANF